MVDMISLPGSTVFSSAGAEAAGALAAGADAAGALLAAGAEAAGLEAAGSLPQAVRPKAIVRAKAIVKIFFIRTNLPFSKMYPSVGSFGRTFRWRIPNLSTFPMDCQSLPHGKVHKY